MLVALVLAQRMRSIYLLDLQLMKTGAAMVETLRFQHTLTEPTWLQKPISSAESLSHRPWVVRCHSPEGILYIAGLRNYEDRRTSCL